MLIFSFTLTKHQSCMDTWTKTGLYLYSNDSLGISLVLTIIFMHTLLFFILFLNLHFWTLSFKESELLSYGILSSPCLFFITLIFHWTVYIICCVAHSCCSLITIHQCCTVIVANFHVSLCLCLCLISLDLRIITW